MREDVSGGGLINISRSEAADLAKLMNTEKVALGRALDRLLADSEEDACNGWTSAF
jgi:hypothetical protein